MGQSHEISDGQGAISLGNGSWVHNNRLLYCHPGPQLFVLCHKVPFGESIWVSWSVVGGLCNTGSGVVFIVAVVGNIDWVGPVSRVPVGVSGHYSFITVV